jgi:DNA-directed RNA polymerase subunit K/omega
MADWEDDDYDPVEVNEPEIVEDGDDDESDISDTDNSIRDELDAIDGSTVQSDQDELDDIDKIHGDIDVEDSDSDSEEDDSYIESLTKEYVNKHIEDHHPEIYTHNYVEIRNLTNITRDRITGIITDPLHKTVPFLTKYEKTRVLGIRSKQINNGGEIYIETPPNVVDGYTISEIELNNKKIPFIIKRPIPNGGCEYWKLADLEII